MFRPYGHKIFRNLWLNRGHTFVVILSITVGIFVMGTIATSQIILAHDLQEIDMVSAPQSTAEPVVHAVLFYSPTCFHCHTVINDVLLPMMDEYGKRLLIMGIDTTQPEGQQLYQATIERYQIPAERRGVPTLVVGEVVLVGSAEIPEQFPGLVETALAADGIGWPDIPNLPQTVPDEVESTPPSTATPTGVAASLPSGATTITTTSPVYLAYFFDPSCLACTRVSAELKELQTQYANLVVKSFNVRDETAMNEAMCEKYSVPEKYRLITPMIFIGQQYLTPDTLTIAHLQTLIENPKTAEFPPPWAGVGGGETGAKEQIIERFEQFSLITVVGAGLLDGVNPCAFTTIIFFVSYLALMGRKGSEVLLVGATFTLAVFLTYLAIGLGLAEGMRQIGAFDLIGRIIYGVTAITCLGLAAVSIFDYVKIRQGKLTEISLQLPKTLKRRVHQTIRTRSRMKGYIGAAFGAGVLVSIFELACTGQVYLPTIVFVTGVADLRLSAFVYLVLYNVMFVVPLTLVFIVTYLGTGSQRLSAIFQSNAGVVKLFTAVLFGVLGVWLGYLILIP